MKRQWRVCRQVKEHPDGQRRWDRAYQNLLLIPAPRLHLPLSLNFLSNR